MTHFLATAALLLGVGNSPDKAPDKRDGCGSARMGFEVSVFGEVKYRMVIYWGYDGFYWDGQRIEFAGLGAFAW